MLELAHVPLPFGPMEETGPWTDLDLITETRGASRGMCSPDLFWSNKGAVPVGAIQTPAPEKDKRLVLLGKKPRACSIRVLARTTAGNGKPGDAQ